MEQAHRRRQGGYRVWFAPGTAPQTGTGTGMALLISNRLASTKVDVKYRDPTGHTLIATLNILNRMQLLLVISHAPSTSSDEAREAYFNTLLSHIPESRAEDPERMGMWMGDFNFEEAPSGDVGKAASTGTRARMLKAYAAVCAKLGSPHIGGLEDAYAITHPHTPRVPTSKACRAIDRILVDPRMVGGLPGLVDATHLHQLEMQVANGKGGRRTAPDHKAVKVTTALSDTRRPPTRPKYTMSGLSDERHGEVCTRVMTTLSDTSLDPEEAEAAYQEHVRTLLDKYNADDRKARRGAKHTLFKKLSSLEAQARAHKRSTPQKQALCAQVQRVSAEIQQLLQAEQRAQARTHEQRRWRQEQRDSRSLFNSIKPDKVVNLPFDELRVPTHVDENGQQHYHEIHGQEAVAAGCTEHWQTLFNHGQQPDEDAVRTLLEPMANDPSCQLSAEQAALLAPEALFTTDAISQAMDDIKKGTMPGGNGITVDLIAHRPWRDAMVAHVSRLCTHIFSNRKEMTPNMREAVISILYKGKGLPRDLCKSHRPVSLTDATCRIIDKVVQTALNKVMPSVLCGINKAFLPKERMEHSTLSLAEVARHVDKHEGGAIVGLDLTAAYDRCSIPFLKEVLRVMGFPSAFTDDVIGTMYNDNWAMLKVNGHLGDKFRQRNGLRQGLPSSCPLWLVYIEPFVRCIRDNTRLKGVLIPGPLGRDRIEHKVTAFADDVNAYCRDGASIAYLLQDEGGPVKIMERASCELISLEKLTITLLGKSMIEAPRPDVRIKEWIRYGMDEADKCLGIRVAKPSQVAEQWFQKAAEIEQLAVDVAAGRRLAGSVYARSKLAKGAFASKIFHTFKVQAPFEPAQREVTKRIQDTLNQLVFGGFNGVALETAEQPSCDAGVGHINIRRRLEAEWAHLVTYLMSSEQAAWKNVWWYELRKVYGDLCERDLPHTTLTYKLFALAASPSQVQKAALAGWAKLRLVPAAHVKPELSKGGEKRHLMAAYSGETIQTTKVWQAQLRRDITGARVLDQRLWFNPCLCVTGHAPSRLAAPSTLDTEKEALEWAEAGLIRFTHVVNGTRVTGVRVFSASHPTLDATLIHAAHTDMPREWREALMRDPHFQRGSPEDCLPRGLLDDEEEEQQPYAMPYATTLVDRPIQPLSLLRCAHIYCALTADTFRTPRVFDPNRGALARHSHLFQHLQEPFRRQHIAQAVGRVKCSAVPPEMTETAYNVLMSAFAFGPSKRGISHRDTCPCGVAAETVEHTFKDCARSKRLWELLLHQWREVTGESKLKATDGRVVLLGDRTGQWLDEAEQGEFAGLEVPFAIMHKATLHILKEERDKDAACRDPHRPRRTASQLYQVVASTCERIMRERWQDARASRRIDSGKAVISFRRQWESPGLVTIPTDGQMPQLLLFLSARARDTHKRKKDSLRSRHFRNQRYAPPQRLPRDTISIFTDGSAIPRKLGELFPAAGWGAVAVRGGRGHEHIDGHGFFEMCGPVNQATPNVTTGTNNSAELVAFTRALQWAYSETAPGRPVCMRYDSCYAAMIASGSWKAKAHKALAVEAHVAWAKLRDKTSNRLWLRHVRGHSRHQWNHKADRLANHGQQGGRKYAYVEA